MVVGRKHGSNGGERCCYNFSLPRLVPLLWVQLLFYRVSIAEALSSSSSFSSNPPMPSSSNNDNEPSPWASSSWLLTLDFGNFNDKEETTMNAFYTNDTPFSSYGASGARLVVKGQVLVTSEDDVQNKKLSDDFVGRGAAVIRADGDVNNGVENDNTKISSRNNDFTYSTMKGSKRMEFAEGGWTLKFPPSGKTNRGRASKLRFYLDLITDIERNDVVLPAGTRLYFAASAWREKDYEVGVLRVVPYQTELKEAQQLLDDNLSHETGDRRLDGTDPIETIKAYGDMAALVLNRDRKQGALREALDQDGHGYPADDDLPEGPWPGDTEWLTLSENNPIYARIPKNKIPKTSAKTKTKNQGNNDGEDKDKKPNELLPQWMGGGETNYCYGRVGMWSGEGISSLLLDDDE